MWASRIWRRYKYFLLVILVGVLLLTSGMQPAFNTQEQTAEQADHGFDLQAFQQSVADSLSQIDGAGRVTVLLSLETGEESVYAADVSKSSQTTDNNSNESYESTTSILSDGSYGEAPILIKSKYPTFRGAVILCEGADDDAVRLQIVHAVSALCGISSDCISVSKLSQ
ncbi:hypothetical protein [Butyricicoccus sp.]|uniref:hypothetical protein n=1 Tax=Butyricicoccus sp. TaxID=2049021 RepID=UPI003D7ED2F9